MIPETRYARSGDVHIAYQVVGEGPTDMILVAEFWHSIEALVGGALVRRVPSRARILRAPDLLRPARHRRHAPAADIRVGARQLLREALYGGVRGVAVHIGQRVLSQADPRECLVSSTVKDLVPGSGLRFSDRGTHALKGVPDEWRLFAVVD